MTQGSSADIPPSIFLSYRRAETADVTGRIHDVLSRTFGPAVVFQDVIDVPAGVDFADHINTLLTDCPVVLVIIGKDWLEQKGADGNRRLENPTDLVRIEVQTALAKAGRVIPVLVQNASMPERDSLPEPLRPLTNLSAIPIRPNPDFVPDAARLITEVRAALDSAERSRTSTAVKASPNEEVVLTPHWVLICWWPLALLLCVVGVVSMGSGKRIFVFPNDTVFHPINPPESAPAVFYPNQYLVTFKAEVTPELAQFKHIAEGQIRNERDLSEAQRPTRNLSVSWACPAVLGMAFFLFVCSSQYRSLVTDWLSLAVAVVVPVVVVVVANPDFPSANGTLPHFWLHVSPIGYLLGGLVMLVSFGLSLGFAEGRGCRIRRDIVLIPTSGSPGGYRLYPTSRLRLVRKHSNRLRHNLLTIGSGDLVLKIEGDDSIQIEIPMVFSARTVMRAVENLVANTSAVVTHAN